MSTPAIGDIRYEVFAPPEPGPGTPWISPMRLEGLSPAGKKARWRALHVEGCPVISYDVKAPPAATPGEAIARFQRYQVRSSFFESDAGADRRVRLILAAEALRAGLKAEDEDASTPAEAPTP